MDLQEFSTFTCLIEICCFFNCGCTQHDYVLHLRVGLVAAESVPIASKNRYAWLPFFFFFLESFLAYKNEFWTNVCSLQSSVLQNLASLTDMNCQHCFIIFCFVRCDAFMFSVCSRSATYHGSGLLDSTTRRWLWPMPCMVEQDTPIVGVVFPVSSHELLISTWILTWVELTGRRQA